MEKCNYTWMSSKDCGDRTISIQGKSVHKCELPYNWYHSRLKIEKHRCSCKAKSPNKKVN